MRRHTIVGHFGSQDDIEISAATNEVVTKLDLLARGTKLSYGIGRSLADLNKAGIFPSELGLDLMVLAALVHAADTRVARTTESQDTWTREFRLVVPVSEPERWISATSLLQRMLNFLTGDRWSFEFRGRPEDFASLAPSRPVNHLCGFDSLSLFSGGLDSLIGAIDLLESGSTPLLISHAGDSSASDAQNACFNRLIEHYQPRPFNRIRVWMNFPKGMVSGVKAEKTTRGRSFLFFALGAFAGTGINPPFVIHVPENGLIALNVPLDVLRLGANSTRTTHPFYMARWNELLALIGLRGRFENPYWSQTKGEMVAACKNSRLLKQVAPISLSCSAPTKGRWRGRGIEHCGYCVPCVIRRAALKAAWGRVKDPTPYTVAELRERTLDTLRAEGQQIRSFQAATERLRVRPELDRILIHKSGPLTDEVSRLNDLAGVYRRGMAEVRALLRGVRSEPMR